MNASSAMPRHRTRAALVGAVTIGGGAPIAVQSMTNTDTADVAATVAPVYVDGEKTVTLKGQRVADEFQQIIADYVRATYGGEPPAPHLEPDRKSISVKAVA